MTRRFAVVLDASGSMGSIIGKARDLGNATASRIQQEDLKARITLMTFESGRIQVLKEKAFSEANYNAGGGTPLYQAILTAIKTLEEKSKTTTYTVIVVTDGCNTDDHDLLSEVKSEIHRLQKTDRWTFAFALPPEFVREFKQRTGVHEGNLLPWTDIEVAAKAIVEGTTVAIKSGDNSTKTFFKVNAPKKKDLRKLKDVTSETTLVTAVKESRIDDLVAKKTKQDYVKGTGFYQVTKKERKVQSYKKILVRDKTTGKVFFDGREALGFPDDQDIKIEPGNLGNNDVFIESRSDNRLIPRGAMVIVWPEAVLVTV